MWGGGDVSYRYGAYRDGDDPLAPPYDIRRALDEMSESVLGGDSPRDALRDLLRRGTMDYVGSTTCLRRVRSSDASCATAPADGTSKRCVACSTPLVGRNARRCSPTRPTTPGCARPSATRARDTARAVRQLSEYDWQSPQARETYEQIRGLLRQELLDSQFRGMKQALQQAQQNPQSLQRVKDMMSSLNDMLEADARGEHTQEQFDEFMRQYGDFFPDSPQNLEELVDSLARRAAAAQRMLASMTPEQRDELANLMASAPTTWIVAQMSDSGLTRYRRPASLIGRDDARR